MDTNFGMGCLFSGPGRGDCAHFVRIPGKSIPGQHDGPDDTVDSYGKPNGWCWSCWKDHKLTTLQSQLTQAHKERDEAVAAAVVMREALEKCTNMYAPSMLIARTALASATAGADFLARLKEAEWLLTHVDKSSESSWNAWLFRRDAWIKGGDK